MTSTRAERERPSGSGGARARAKTDAARAQARRGRVRRVLPFLVLFAAAGLPLLPTLDNGFVYDDKVLLGVAWGDLGDALTEDLFGRDDEGRPATGYYRPAIRLSYHANHAIHRALGLGAEGAATGFHLTNLLLHAAISILLWRALRSVGALRPFAFATALVFAAHPIHSESICLITGRTDPLALLFLLLAWFPAASGRLAAAAAFYALAQLSKESAVAMLPLLAAAPLVAGAGPAPVEVTTRRRRAAALLGGGLAISAAFFAVKVLVLGIVPPPDVWTGDGNLGQRFLTFLAVVPRYLGLLAWPDDLSITHAVSLVRGAADPALWVGVLVAAAIVALLVSRRLPLRAGAALFVLPLLPASNVVPITYAYSDIPFPFFERYLYAPSIGAILVAVVLLDDLLVRFVAPAGRARTLAAGAGVLALVLGARQWDRAADFRSDVTLLRSAMTRGYAAEEVRLKQAGALYLEGRWAEALAAYDAFLADAPTHRAARLERAQLLASMAERRLEQQAATLAAGDAELAGRLRRDAEGWLREAAATVEARLAEDPRDGWATEVKAALTGIGGDLEGAAVLYRRASELPGTTTELARNYRFVAEALRARADAIRQGGATRIREAMAAYDRVLRLVAGDNPPRRIPEAVKDVVVRTLAEYGDTQVLAGQAVQAASTFRWVLEHDPKQYRAHEGLGYLAHQAGDRAEAYRRFEQALRIEPDALTALSEMYTMLSEEGRHEEAADYVLRLQDLYERKGIRRGDAPGDEEGGGPAGADPDAAPGADPGAGQGGAGPGG